MNMRLLLLAASVVLATPAFAGGHPNGKASEFYAIQKGTDRKTTNPPASNVDARPTGTVSPTCTGKECKRR